VYLLELIYWLCYKNQGLHQVKKEVVPHEAYNEVMPHCKAQWPMDERRNKRE